MAEDQPGKIPSPSLSLPFVFFPHVFLPFPFPIASFSSFFFVFIISFILIIITCYYEVNMPHLNHSHTPKMLILLLALMHKANWGLEG